MISKFISKHSSFGSEIRYKEELIKELSNIKIDLNSSGYGRLISLDFKKLKAKHSNYIDFLTISYIKTQESYFILHIEVKPSKKFEKIKSKILESLEISLSVRHFNSFKNILKYRLFTGYTSFKTSLTRENIDNLISDLQYQINYNILNHLKGYFITSKLSSKIPKIEHYTTKRFKTYKKKHALDFFFNFSNIVQFTSKDELIDVYIDKENDTIYIIKEEGHGMKNNSGKDYTDYDKLESYFLIKSMVFPCVFESLLNQEFIKLNQIKRKMYDFFENTHQWNFFKYFSLFNQNKSYLKLKKETTKLNLITNRYKNEFNNSSLTFLINYSSDINEYKYSKENRKQNDEYNLLNYFIEKFKSEIEYLTDKKDDINLVFKNIEELNTYRTNYTLQVLSLFIGIFAFIFAFDKVKDLIISIFDLINNLPYNIN